MKSIYRYGELSREDYAKVGFKSGLEIHQQLYTEKKLFCHCPAGRYSTHHDAAVLRHMRPTLSELGEYDGTALMEFKKKKDVIYLLNNETVCTYEIDDTPPFMINQDALDIAIEIALLLNCSIVGELHIIRKQYLDGSIPTGFQRTAIVGVNGWIPWESAPGGRVRIRQLAIEEDSCREVSDVGHTITFRADRLSMPLIEIVTEPDMLTPEDCEAVGWELAKITRSTGKIRRGLGSVRQDVNVSVRGGTRVEAKGVPRLGLIPRITHYEAQRQIAFLKLQEELKKAGFTAKDSDFIEKDILPTVYETEYSPWKEAVESEGTVRALRIRNFGDYTDFPVNPRRVFMDEISDIVKVVACIDELPNVIWRKGDVISNVTMDRIRAFMGAEDKDAVCIVAGNPADVKTAMREIRDRIRLAVEKGVPEETRRQVRGGSTRFERVLPGPDRMYPDTDLPPLPITFERIERIRKNTPDFTWNRRDRYTDLGLSKTLASELLTLGIADRFDKLSIQKPPFSYSYLAHLLTATVKSLRRRGVPVDKLDVDSFEKVMDAVRLGSIAKEAVAAALAHLANHPDTKPEELQAALKIPKLTEKDIDKAIADTIKAKGPDHCKGDAGCKYRYFMGELMRKYRGSLDGNILARKMEKALTA